MTQPTILALDTSTKACSVALLHQGRVTLNHQMTPQTHANLLLAMIQQTMADAEVSSKQIDVLAFGEGPGAFTGIRIASGAIQGLALGWDKPVIAISSLAAMARAGLAELSFAEEKNPLKVNWIALMDARMKEVYWQQGSCQLDGEKWQETQAEMLSPIEIEERLAQCIAQQHEAFDQTKGQSILLVVGDIVAEYPNLVAQVCAAEDKGVIWCEQLPSADAMVHLAAQKIDQAHGVDEALPKPVYLRNHVADTIAERKAKALQG